MTQFRYAAELNAISIIFILLAAFDSHAATLRWGSSPGSPNGYKVYYSTSATNLSTSKDVGNVTAYNLDKLPLSENVRYYFSVSAYNAAGESERSATVDYIPGDTTPPNPPLGLVAAIQSDSSSQDFPSSGALVSNLSVASGKKYQPRSGLANGSKAYIDRSYSYHNVPDLIEGATYIQTANNDKAYSATKLISFDASRDVTVYVAHDDRIKTKPAWLKNFTDTFKDLQSDVRMSIYKKNYPAGRISLGDNGGNSGVSMYTISVK
jgi:hypothetical protein